MLLLPMMFLEDIELCFERGCQLEINTKPISRFKTHNSTRSSTCRLILEHNS